MEDRERIYEFSKLKLNWDQLMEEIGKQLKEGFVFYIKKGGMILILEALMTKIHAGLNYHITIKYRELYLRLKEIVNGK